MTFYIEYVRRLLWEIPIVTSYNQFVKLMPYDPSLKLSLLPFLDPLDVRWALKKLVG